MRGRRTSNLLWSDPKYQKGMCGVCRKRPREFTHSEYPSMCESCRETRTKPFVADAQEQRVNTAYTQMRTMGTKEDIQKWAREQSSAMLKRQLECSKFERKLDPRIQALLNKQETGK